MIWIYNRIVKNKNHILFTEQNMDVQLKKRFETLPNIASTVKKFLIHEKELHSKIAELRSKYSETTDKTEKSKIEQELSKTLSHILVSVENYPELKTDESVMHLQRTINELAEQISASQRAYNSSVLAYNDSISVFPDNLIAKIFGFSEENYASIISEKEKENININQFL